MDRTGLKRGAGSDATRARVIQDFSRAVNMTARRLAAWLETDESREVGWRASPADESVGHRSGRRIVAILKKKERDLTDDDIAHMRRVVGFVRRHLAQRPYDDTIASRWARSLMNWGHDPSRGQVRVRRLP